MASGDEDGGGDGCFENSDTLGVCANGSRWK